MYLYFLPQAGAAAGAEGLGAWVIGPDEKLTDDNYARSSATTVRALDPNPSPSPNPNPKP